MMVDYGKVAVVTRAFNRLEYTTQCVSRVRNATDYPNYEHIVINQASTDGTQEWLDWITRMENGWFSRVRPIHNERNSGDWGGMRDAVNHVGDAEYIVQLDNDILVPQGWLTALVDVLNKTGGSSVMLKREGVGGTIPVTKNIDWGRYQGGEVNGSVACYVCRRVQFFDVVKSIRSCDHISRSLGRPAYKITSLRCYHMDGYSKDGYIQKEKYGPANAKQVL